PKNNTHNKERAPPKKGERKSRSRCAYSRPSLPLWMLGSGVKMLSCCPVLKQFAVLLTRRSQYRSRASHQKARSKALDLASTQLDRLDGVPALPAQVSV